MLNRSFLTQTEISSTFDSNSQERMELVDRGLRGLMLIKRKNGPTKWFLKYQCPRTLQKRSVSFGLYPDVPLDIARQQAMQLIRQEYGDDQFELMNSPAHSFHDFTAQENVGGGGGGGI